MRGRQHEPVLLLGGLSYFEYQQRLAREIVIPWLAARLDLEGTLVGDFGAHGGGMLDAFRSWGEISGAVGLEVSEEVVFSSPFVGDDCFRLEIADLMAVEVDEYDFDFVLLHDVLEHIPDSDRALAAVGRALGKKGHVFVSFPPYYSAFGGHQQLASGRARMVPFVHFLPAGLFFRLARPGEQEYMTADSAYEDLRSVRRTRLTVTSAEAAFARAGLRIVDRELFLVRPEYTVRYGLAARSAGPLGKLPGVRELVVNGAYYLLRAGGP